MYALRGRREELSADLAVTDDLVERTRETGEGGVRVWRPPENVAFGRRDSNRDGYERARQIAADHGYPIAERSVGGHAVAFTGNTVAFAVTEPVEDSRTGITERYDRVTGRVNAALSEVGVDAHEGEPEGAFCPGTHSLSAAGKIAGLAQRVHSDVAVTSGILMVEDHAAVADVLAPLYDALAVDFERDAVGSVARAGGETGAVVDAVIHHLAGDDPTVDSV